VRFGIRGRCMANTEPALTAIPFRNSLVSYSYFTGANSLNIYICDLLRAYGSWGAYFCTVQ